MFERLIKKILRKEKRKGIINLVLVNDKKIRNLNRRFRHKDRATDVLAFPMGENGILGDIAISTEAAVKNARRYGVSFGREMKRLAVHGVLHLLDYEHGKEMRHAEEIYQKL